jgi:hypothetical protein
MRKIEEILEGACEDQREALMRFHRSGSLDDCVGVHFDACPICERAVEELIAMRGAAAQSERPIVRPRPYAALIALGLVLLAALGSVTYVLVRPFLGDATADGAEGLQARLRYVRMPGHPDVCVATLPGVGGYGPTYLGAARCAQVRDRVTFDEGASADLASFTVERVEGTPECLAYRRADVAFTFPCGD